MGYYKDGKWVFDAVDEASGYGYAGTQESTRISGNAVEAMAQELEAAKESAANWMFTAAQLQAKLDATTKELYLCRENYMAAGAISDFMDKRSRTCKSCADAAIDNAMQAGLEFCEFCLYLGKMNHTAFDMCEKAVTLLRAELGETK